MICGCSRRLDASNFDVCFGLRVSSSIADGFQIIWSRGQALEAWVAPIPTLLRTQATARLFEACRPTGHGMAFSAFLTTLFAI
eukprot:3729126-Amphidinium_carterae.1